MTEHPARADEIRIRRVLSAIEGREQQAVNIENAQNHSVGQVQAQMCRDEARAIRQTLEKAEGMSLEDLQDRARHG